MSSKDILQMASRFCSNLATAFRFNHAGASWSSLLLYPFLRRTRNSRNVIKVRGGFTISAPPDVELAALFQEIWVDRCYAPQSPESGVPNTIIDIGAHVGVFTIWAAAQFPMSRIVSLEPFPESFKTLRENCTCNRLSNVHLLQSACGGHSGSALLYRRGSASMSTLYPRDLLGSTFRPACNVPVISLEDLFRKFDIERPSLLKLDCEGAEYEILMNASDAVLGRLKHIVLEYHVGLNVGNPDALARFLTHKGFDTVVLPRRSVEDGYLYAKLRDP